MQGIPAPGPVFPAVVTCDVFRPPLWVPAGLWVYGVTINEFLTTKARYHLLNMIVTKMI